MTANKEEIEKQAKQILDNFSKALESVKAKPEKTKLSQAPFRQESNPKTCDPKFKKLMFANAPNKDENCIIAEKAQW